MDFPFPHVILNHVGFLTHARKRVVVSSGAYTRFAVQNMGIPAAESLGAHEDWQTLLEKPLLPVKTDMGDFLVGDFSELTRPGVYRVVIPGADGRSFMFVIADGAFHHLPGLWLDFIHDRRSGNFEDDLRGPSHLDDGVRADTGQWHDASGGWYDAGDLRKWIGMSPIPAWGMLDYAQTAHRIRNHYAAEGISPNDFLTEAAWEADFLLKVQDPDTGMIFEEIGGGGDGRKLPGMQWWYNNHSGCYADNSQNYFSDNQPGNEDDRRIRTDYNPIAQYMNQYILLRAAEALKPYQPEKAASYLAAALKNRAFTQSRQGTDPMHRWTAVRAWALQCALEWKKTGEAADTEILQKLDLVLENRWPEQGWWWMDTEKAMPYRGIVHAAQPLVALCAWLDSFPDAEKAVEVTEILHSTVAQYIQPMLATNPFGMMPFGLYLTPYTQQDTYRPLQNGLWYRFFMPEHSPERVNHGLAGHWTAWAHALAALSQHLSLPGLADAAWDQVYWLLGNNPLGSSLVTGVGYRQAMPHSRFHGQIPGGFMVGPRGNAADEISIDLDARAEWNSTEYWNTPVAYALLAFTHLLPNPVPATGKLGYHP